MEIFIQNFDKIMYRFQVTEIIVIYIDANAEVQASVSTIDDFEISKL